MATKQEEVVRVVESYFTQAGSPARKETLTIAMLRDLAHIGVVIKKRYCGMSHQNTWQEVFTVEPLIK